MGLEIPFVDKSIDKNDKKPVTNLSINMGRQRRQKRQKNRVEFIAKFFILCYRTHVARSVGGHSYSNYAKGRGEVVSK